MKKSKSIFLVCSLVLCAFLLTSCASVVSSQSASSTQYERAQVNSTPIPVSTPSPTLQPFNHNNITMKSVNSTSLAKVGYDSDYSILKVQFKNSGEYYIYYDVPQSTYTALLNAESIGSYFYYNIRTSFEYEKVS